ncbi:MAG: TIGR01459 family HAD-type hydrolase [Rhodospirillales bacterium]|nr:TIGR01459 family HAD-type hydrolase [Rhodospirillales bacterium]
MPHDRAATGVLPETIAGMSALAERFDGFVLDQWGVLHNGVHPYPGAIDCLQRLRVAGKKVVIVTNSGRRSDVNQGIMARLGFAEYLYDQMITAGEDARRALERREDPFYATLGQRCYVISRDDDHSVLEGVGLTFATDVESADFLFVIGMDSPRRLLADYENLLADAVARGLPLICANPDFTRVTTSGTTEAPGVLARRYAELGGRVCWHGKPHRPIYESCLRALGLPASRVVAVGDSVDHDIVGAATVNIASAMIAGGIHAEALGIAWGGTPSSMAQQRFFASATARPRFLAPAFTWSGPPS